MDLNPENKSLLPIFDGATSQQFLVILIHVLILIQVQKTKKQFPRLMAEFIQIGKLTKKNEPALLSLY